MKQTFRGLGTALATPFGKGGALDEKALRRLLQFQIRGKVDFLVPLGTTGEASTLDESEYFRVVEICQEEAGGKVPLLVGAGSNNTAHSVHLTRRLHQMGVDGTLQVVPYYNKPTQDGQYRHFAEIAAAAPLAMIIYNIQGRTSVNMNTSTLMRLGEIPNVVGVKEASGNLNQIMEVLRRRPKTLAVLSGDDAWGFPVIACGGDGIISVASNIIPDQMKKMIALALTGRMDDARKIHYRLMEIFQGLFLETNPIPVKTALAAMGKIRDEFRLPLSPMQADNKKKLLDILRRAKIIR
ncbi:MAG TPA: 4-hydroxy-tetrahydrodipicolinate synthase [Acidobacteriota bacterium]|jgi:4-hydroxy-tetrahydrodipicolinate synthase